MRMIFIYAFFLLASAPGCGPRYRYDAVEISVLGGAGTETPCGWGYVYRTPLSHNVYPGVAVPRLP